MAVPIFLRLLDSVAEEVIAVHEDLLVFRCTQEYKTLRSIFEQETKFASVFFVEHLNKR